MTSMYRHEAKREEPQSAANVDSVHGTNSVHRRLIIEIIQTFIRNFFFFFFFFFFFSDRIYLLSSPATVSCSLLYRCDRQKWRVIRSTYRFRRSMEISSTKDDTRENQAMPHYFRRQEFLLSLGSRPVIHRESYLSESKKQTSRQRRQYPHNADDPPGPQ